MDQLSRGSLKRHKIFSLCLRASVIKCYEFCLDARDKRRTKNRFFSISALRGVCEDLIVLRFISRLPSDDRELLITSLANHESATRVKLQDEFFSSFRPQQPVLRLPDADATIEQNERAAQSVWHRHGWPNLSRGAMPQIRQIAEKQGAPQLAILYDYLYRLTSGGVHFSAQSLMRSGWGPNLRKFTFSTKHFDSFFSEYCSVYSAFMLCTYFEFFGNYLKPSKEDAAHINKIREDILFTPRWPEMVTFEEMNLKYPHEDRTMQMIISAIQAVIRNRLVTDINYKDTKNSEIKMIESVLKTLNEADKDELRAASK